MRWAALCVGLWLLPGAMAQDERRVTSPNGAVEFRAFIVGAQKDTTFSRLAYEVFADGGKIVGTSLMGLDIYDEEPILGENVGLISAVAGSAPEYRSLVLNYMQNGSTGRSLTLEVRAYDTGVAFRYIVPRSALLENIIVAEELTEYRVAGLKGGDRLKLPVRIPLARGSLTITEVPRKGWPAMALIRDEDGWVSTLGESRDQPQAAYAGQTPVVCPWRVIAVGDPGPILSNLEASR